MKVITLMWRHLGAGEFGKDVVLVPRHLAEASGAVAKIVCGYDDDLSDAVSAHSDGTVTFVRRPLGYRPSSRILHNVLYLLGHSRETDVLMCFHWRPETLVNILTYKMMHPSGKVYVKLDTVAGREFDLSRCGAFGRAMRRFVYRPLLALTDVLSCETSTAMENIIRCHGDFPSLKDRTVLLPDPVDEAALRPSDPLPPRENMFLTVGRLGTSQKNSELILKALALIDDPHGWRFVLAGPATPEFASSVRSFVADNPRYDGLVSLEGELWDKERLRELYGRARAFVLTSRWESYGIVLAEAACFGCHIISTDVGAARDIISGGGGTLIPQDDAVALSEALKAVMEGNCDSPVYTKEAYEDSLSRISRILGL